MSVCEWAFRLQQNSGCRRLESSSGRTLGKRKSIPRLSTQNLFPLPVSTFEIKQHIDIYRPPTHMMSESTAGIEYGPTIYIWWGQIQFLQWLRSSYGRAALFQYLARYRIAPLVGEWVFSLHARLQRRLGSNPGHDFHLYANHTPVLVHSLIQTTNLHWYKLYKKKLYIYMISYYRWMYKDAWISYPFNL